MADYVPVTADDLEVDDDIKVSADPEAPDADRWEQAQPARSAGWNQLSADPEVSEADALDQATEVGGLGFDDLDDR
jgi:hypothetical protein